jgi:ferric-dicitrate binding protein FerR (iron transport regulator)
VIPVIPARCERSREWTSLRLDGQLSSFEAALLDRHLRRCASCRAFAAGATAQTQLLRAQPLEQPLRRVEVPGRPARVGRRGLAGTVVTAAAAAAAAAVVAVSPFSHGQAARRATAANGPELAVIAGQPTPSSTVEVPRLKVEPASLADGPVRGQFSLPA